MFTKPATLVWITGSRTKITHRSQTIRALDKLGYTRSVSIPKCHIHNEEKVVGAEEYRFLIPQWLAHQNKLGWYMDFAARNNTIEHHFQRAATPNTTENYMNVTIDSYSDLAMRTAKIMEDKTDMLVHGALGLMTEVGEFAEGMPSQSRPPVPAGYLEKELGDGFWFANYLAVTLGMNFANMYRYAEVMGYSPDPAITEYIARTSAVGTRIKALKFYGKPLETDRMQLDLINVLNVLQKICKYMKFPIESILTGNIEKLQQRYPEKYTDQDAVARADENTELSAGSIVEATAAYTNQDGGAAPTGAFDPLPTSSTQH